MRNSNKPQLRSTSLPIRLTQSSSQIEINLNKFKTLVPSFYSSASIHDGLACLIDLYLSVDELIGLPQIQQVRLQSGNKILIEDALDVSTQLLDSHSKLVELFTIIKGNIRTLQIALRRKSVSADSSRTEVHSFDYVLSRKKARKHIVKCLVSLEQMEKEIKLSLMVGEDCHLSMVIGVLKEIVIATISLFRSLMVCMSGKTKLDKGFSLKNFMTLGRQSGDISKEYISDIDIDIIDGTLRYLQKNIRKNESNTITIDKQMSMDRLQNLDCQIESYELGLECLFRKVIQTRVSLLNILAN